MKIFKQGYIRDGFFVAAFTLVAFLLLSAVHLEHTLLFLFPVPIAVFTIKYEDSKAIFPLSIIVALSAFILLPLDRFNPLMEGFVVLTITAIVGVLHGYIAERHMSHFLRLTVIIIADVIANVLILLVFAPSIFGYTMADEVLHGLHNFFELIDFLNLSPSFIQIIEDFGVSIVTTVVITTGIVEAILTHVVVHAVAKRIFHIEYGHTFTGIGILMPRWVSFIFLPILIATLIFLPQYATLTGIWEHIHAIGMNIAAIGFVFYLLDGYTLTIRYFGVRHHRRAYLLSTVLMIVLAPLMFILGIIDSIFVLQPRLQMKIRF